MSVSPYGVIIALLLLSVISLSVATHHMRGELAKSRQGEATLRAQLGEVIVERDAERLRIIDTARRLDEALTLFMDRTGGARHEHEERMEAVSRIDTPEAVDWLCEPVPDDIRRLLVCDASDTVCDGTGGETDASGGADTSVH